MRHLLIALLCSAALFAQDSFQVRVLGHGQPMILIPGLSSDGPGTWDSTVARYKDRFECHVITLAGFVGVPYVEPPTGMTMMAKVREDLAAYIKAHELSKPVIVGHSLGGYAVMDFASHYPEVASKLIIVDTYPFTMGVDPEMTPAKAKELAPQIRDAIRSQTKEAGEAYVKAGSATNEMVTSEAGKKRLIEWALDSDLRATADALGDMLGADLRDDVGKIRVPTMVLAAWRGSEGVGANHEIVDKNMHDQFRKLEGVQIKIVDTARHFIMWDDPEWMFGHFDAFLGAK